jgi:hypothetical protein
VVRVQHAMRQSALIELPAKNLVAGVDTHTASMRRHADSSKKGAAVAGGSR